MVKNMKKAKEYLKKFAAGAKKGFKETKEVIEEYGPKVHRYSESVARGVTKAFETTPRAGMRAEFSPKGAIGRKPKKRPGRIDWNNLGVRY